MYLLAFITLLVVIVGLHAQVMAVQAGKMYRAQNALAQTMVAWHNTAARLAHNTGNLPTNISGTTGCSQTTAYTVVTPCDKAAARVSSADLPTGYNMTYYTFPTLLYEPTTSQRYVVTFVGYTDTQGLIQLPGGVASNRTLPFTVGGLLSQLANTKTPGLSYGTVNTVGTLTIVPDQTTKMVDDTTTAPMSSLSFTVPTSIPRYSVAIISTAL